MNHICLHRSSVWRSAKAAQNPPSTMVPLVSPETAGSSSRKKRKIEDPCSRKRRSRALNYLAIDFWPLASPTYDPEVHAALRCAWVVRSDYLAPFTHLSQANRIAEGPTFLDLSP